MQSIAELLRSRRTDVLGAWEVDAHGPSPIPRLFDALVAALDRFDGGEEAGAGRKIAAELVAADGGGASIAAVLHDLGRLRERIVDLSLSAFESGELQPRGMRFVHAALDECMCAAAVGMQRTEASDRERFVAVLGHDLRTPLNAIKMAGAILLAEQLPAEQASFAQKIVRAADRMNRLIGDLLDFAALRAGTLVMERKRCNLESVCGEVIDELRLAHADRLVAFDAKGDCTGSWDAQRMAQVVSNLVANALTYSPPGSPVLVSLRGVATVVEIEVHNEGASIPREDQACIFTPFKRGSKRKSGGVGLGLFIANEMVHAHGGSISLHSEPADGTTFVVHVPRAA